MLPPNTQGYTSLKGKSMILKKGFLGIRGFESLNIKWKLHSMPLNLNRHFDCLQRERMSTDVYVCLSVSLKIKREGYIMRGLLCIKQAMLSLREVKPLANVTRDIVAVRAHVQIRLAPSPDVIETVRLLTQE